MHVDCPEADHLPSAQAVQDGGVPAVPAEHADKMHAVAPTSDVSPTPHAVQYGRYV